MGTVMLLIGSGLFFSLIVFFICEEKSLSGANFSDMKCMVAPDANVTDCFAQYETIRYTSYYFLMVSAFALAIGYFVFIPEHYGLQEVLAYTFITSLLGSALILFVKWQKQPMIKLISSFMFGAIFMAGTAVALAFVYLLNP